MKPIVARKAILIFLISLLSAGAVWKVACEPWGTYAAFVGSVGCRDTLFFGGWTCIVMSPDPDTLGAIAMFLVLLIAPLAHVSIRRLIRWVDG